MLALVIFLVVAVVTAALAGRFARTGQIPPVACAPCDGCMNLRAACRASRQLDDVAEGAASEIHASLGRAVIVLLAHGDDLELAAAWPPEDALDAAPMTAARWAFSHSEPAGADTGTLPIVPWYFVPLRIGDKTLGVIGVARPQGMAPFDSEARALLDTLSEQTAAALDRAIAGARYGERQNRDRNGTGA